MGKIETLKERFPKIREVSFDRIVKEDLTPTKKYLEIMLKFWSKKNEQNQDYITSIKHMGNTIKKFEELLPYIVNKDIYSSHYYRFSVVEQTVFDAEKIKIDKTFVKEDNVDVIFEDDKTMLLRPLTHIGSLKYGSDAKWCTASKTDKKTFNSYFTSGFLFYLIDKTSSKQGNYNKVAFYSDNKSDSLFSYYQIYNQADSCVNIGTLLKNGWEYDTLFNLTAAMRYYAQILIDNENTKKQVKADMSKLENFNFQRFYENLHKLKVINDIESYKNFQPILDKFVEKIKAF